MWLSAFLDLAPGKFAVGASFWQAATGYQLDAVDPDYSLLQPDVGDGYLGVYRLSEGLPRLHLDVHVVDSAAAFERAAALGASLVDQSYPGYLMMTSPGGVGFCLLTQAAATVPAAKSWPSGHLSRVGQVCLDIPGASYATEVDFWGQLLGGDWQQPDAGDPLVLRPADGFAFDLRLQPSQFADMPMGHLHIVTDDRPAEVARLVEAGAVVRAVREHTSVLEPPGGLAVCVVDQDRDEILWRA